MTAVRRLPACEARFGDEVAAVDGRLRAALRERGIRGFYTHQATAIEHALDHRNVVITTPTASGKTLCYNAPVLSRVLQDPSARALYLFPTKALAQDQLAELHGLSDQLSRRSDLDIGVFTYDGDTPQDARRAIRGRAHVVLSNPDMLHSSLLPYHPRWAKLFVSALSSSSTSCTLSWRLRQPPSNVIRRLRVCRTTDRSDVHLLVCDDCKPSRIGRGARGGPFALVSENGAPRGEKFFLS